MDDELRVILDAIPAPVFYTDAEGKPRDAIGLCV
jgi:hypothetical protein